ncbi:hypothetical protein SS50377_22524 [Spironucleus salmonicida]|uniref:Uncharacterized protein n=1 Tax=Spironucleus salmonicida TaxID=348837 RepID=V6LBZ7_9EUKA|nr:hypothetical protein SS50377_22524 [Spironucleus salmonicida]|eukprot:EST41987.1 Hypothetical protein SS50377_18292 [Spironucleus salmonicida]
MKNFIQMHLAKLPVLLPLQPRSIRHLASLDHTDAKDVDWLCTFLLKQNSFHVYQAFQMVDPFNFIFSPQFQVALAQISSQNQLFTLIPEGNFPIIFRLFLCFPNEHLLTIVANYIFDVPDVIFLVKAELDQLDYVSIPADNLTLLLYYISKNQQACSQISGVLTTWINHIKYEDLQPHSEQLLAKIVYNLSDVVIGVEEIM